jgi:hypothetical protein
MASCSTDSLSSSYANVELAKQWWIQAFGCQVAEEPPDWDDPQPSDVALKLPGSKEPTILLSAEAEVEQAGFDRPVPVASRASNFAFLALDEDIPARVRL